MKSTDNKNFSQPEAIECSLSVIQQTSEDNPLMLKDKWDGKEDLGIRVNKHQSKKHIDFSKFPQLWLKNAGKRYILYRLLQRKSFSTVEYETYALLRFSRFLASHYILSFEDINDEVLELYIKSLNNLDASPKKNRILVVKWFLDKGTIEGWFNVSTYLLDKEARKIKVKREKPEYIPDEVLRQLDEHLYLLPGPLQRMVILFRTLGLRASELFQLRYDCLQQHKNGIWDIQFTNWKFNEQLDKRIGSINRGSETELEEQNYFIGTS